MAATKNRTKRMLAAGELALGFGVHHLRTAATSLIAKVAGYDWLFIDMEHGAFSLHEATQICIAALATDVTPIVRVTADALGEGTRALDNGALGIVIPHVDDVDQARRIARAFRYPPLGTRSWGGPPVVLGYGGPGAAEAQALLNEEILVVAMIESREGVRNAEQIIAVPGIDAVLIGTSDLTADLGIAGQLGHPEIQAAYKAVGSACREYKKALGMGGVYDQEWATKYIVEAGARFVLTGSDHTFVVAGAKQRSELLRSISLKDT